MAQTPEGKVKAKVKKLLDSLGIYYFSPYMAGFGRSGIPDIVCCVEGLFLGIECKAGSNKPTALQEREAERIKKAGGITLVVNENELPALERLLNNIPRTQ